MSYPIQTWHDAPATDTPISAARLGVMEAGIAAAATAADYNFLPADHGYLAWTHDPIISTTGSVLGVGGLAYASVIKIPVAMTITNIVCFVTTIPGTLVDSYVALYNPANTLLSQSANLNALWGTSGVKVCPLSTPQAVTPGKYRIVHWATVSSGALPGLLRASSQSSNNAGLSNANSRWATANSGLTTTAPATLTSISPSGIGAWWLALS